MASNLKVWRIILLLLFVVILCPFADGKVMYLDDDTITATASLPRDSYYIGQPVPIEIVFTNNGQEPAYIKVDEFGFLRTNVIVENANGSRIYPLGVPSPPPPPRHWWITVDGKKIYTEPVVEIEPGQTTKLAIQDSLDLYHDQLQPGTYYLTPREQEVIHEVDSMIIREDQEYKLWIDPSTIIISARYVVIKVKITLFQGKIIYVDDDAIGNNDGSSWQNAYTFLQDALADARIAEKPVEIRVAQGIYKPNRRTLQTLSDGDNTFTLINEVTLKGGYAGFGEPDPNARYWDLYKSVLSGDLNGDDVEVVDPCDMLLIESNRSDNTPVVVRANYTDATTVLDGFVITGGYFMDMYTMPSNGGAGMHIYQGSPTILNCTFTGNAAYHIGGGLLNRGGSNPTLINCAFIGNYAESGGGIYNTSNMPAPGMISEGSHPTLVSCTFDNNCAFRNGGGMYNSASYPTLIDCTFRRNQVTGPYSGSTRGPHTGGGGGIYNSNSNPELTNCLFSENSAGDGGGICTVADSNVTLADCTFNGNSAFVRGGGLSNRENCNITITNCLIVGNWSEDYGGGIFSNGEITLLNCTIFGNRARSYYGGGIYLGVGRISNSIIYGNIIPGIKGSEIAQGPHGAAGCRPEFIKITHSLVGNDPNAFDIQQCYSGEWLYADPLFVNPGYWDPNGTPDDTIDDFWIDGDYHLKSHAGRWDTASEGWIVDDVTSPCIDAGDPNMPVGDEPMPNGGRINMGAYGGMEQASLSLSTIQVVPAIPP